MRIVIMGTLILTGLHLRRLTMRKDILGEVPQHLELGFQGC